MRLGSAITCMLACWATVSAGVKLQEPKTYPLLDEKGEFTALSPKDKVKTDCPGKPYPLKCVGGRTYTIDMRSEEFDSFLRLEDGNGRTIMEDDDSGGGKTGHDARIVFKCDKPGDYTIAATSYNRGAKGKFTVTVVHDGAGKDEAVAYLIDKTAKLTRDDPKEKDRGGICFFKQFPIEMKAGTTYVIQMDSNDFDSYLRLLNPEGKEVAHDDDGAKDGLNARLVYRCERAGNYTIITTSSLHPDTGEFRLRVHAKE
jgi:serine protease Do